MQSFIRRCKREAQYEKKRQVDKDKMYVVQDGEIIPLKDVSAPVNGEPTGDFTTIICTENSVGDSSGDGEGSSSIGDSRDDVIESGNMAQIKDVRNEAADDTTHLPATAKGKHGNGETSSEEAIVNDTGTTRNKEYLDKVIEDFQELISHEKEETYSNEGAPCSVVGDWDSDAAGMQIRIQHCSSSPNGPHKLTVKLVEREPPKEDGLLCSGQWEISGQEPFNHSSLVVLTAVSKKSKKVISFIGECRICDGAETISGNWMEGRSSRNCKDRLGTHSFHSDVLRKNNVRKLQRTHLQELTTTQLPSTLTTSQTSSTA
ncbi:hypothetical protein NQ318_010834 [Aromia moschata]|uniref:Uncharacterized protein n=1 Tax=Aromia moschata TaxID=1265417 RepID=A0AAV8YJE5_9CUCU|nr:hypothetical protein NQ318_010834 [Aromia moschata]